MLQNTTDISHSRLLHFLQIGAFGFIVLWGIRASSEILGPLLLSVVLSFGVLPFPVWLMKRFKFPKSKATAVTALALAIAGLLLILSMESGIARLMTRMPVYQQNLVVLHDQIEALLSAHGIEPTSLSLKQMLTPERLSAIAIAIVPQAGGVFAKVLLIFLIALLLVVEMLPGAGGKLGLLGQYMAHYGSFSRSYISVTAKSAVINSLVNLAFLLAMGVDEALLWSFLYFFLDFVPTLGFSIALIPPTLVTLLMHGWERALVVAGGLILTNLIVDNFVMPIFARHAMDISLFEITLSLLGWAFLLGLPGAIIAIPATSALKEFIGKSRGKGLPAVQPAGETS